MSDIFKTKQNNQWVGIPALIGPQGPEGPQGIQGPKGDTGDAAGIGSVTATATSLPAGSSPTASATCSGPDTNKSFAFTFGIPDGGGETTQVQSDWSQTQTDAADYIKNKPTNVSAFTNDAGYVTASQVPAAQVQSDWNQTDSSAVDYIKNKPSSTLQEQADWTETNTTAPSYVRNKPDLSLKEDKSNKTTSISASSTNTQYPSAKCVYDQLQAGVGTKYVEHAGWLTDRPLLLTSTNFDLGVTHIYHVNITNSGDTGRTYTLFSVDSGDTSLWKVNDTFLERNSAYNYGYSYYLSVYVGNGGTHRNDYLITRVR